MLYLFGKNAMEAVLCSDQNIRRHTMLMWLMMLILRWCSSFFSLALIHYLDLQNKLIRTQPNGFSLGTVDIWSLLNRVIFLNYFWILPSELCLELHLFLTQNSFVWEIIHIFVVCVRFCWQAFPLLLKKKLIISRFNKTLDFWVID